MIVACEFSSSHYHLLQIPMNLNQYKYGSQLIVNYIETARKPEYCVFTIRGLDYYILRCLEEWF